MAKIVRLLGSAWIYLGLIVILIGYAATVYFHGFGAFVDMINPHGGHGIVNMILVVITLAPGFVLIHAAEAIEHSQRKRAVVSLILFPIAASLSVGLFWVGLGKPKTVSAQAETLKVTRVETIDGNMRCLWARDRLVTVISGPCDNFVPPRQVRIGETFQANGKTKTINVIQADRVSKDLPTLGLKAGDVTCTAAESAANIPSGSGKREHTGTWLYIAKCKAVE